MAIVRDQEEVRAALVMNTTMPARAAELASTDHSRRRPIPVEREGQDKR
ncbi:hypothetical protein [Alsobacter sp. SYSU BS001988]